MLVNELLQWATLLLILIVVLGLARQLAVFMQPHDEQLAEAGPGVGDRVRDDFLPAASVERLTDLMRARETEAGLVLVLSEQCTGCVSVLEYLERSPEIPLPLAAVAKESGDDFAARLAEVFDTVVEDRDGSRVEAAGIVATPYAVTLGTDGRVSGRAAAIGVYDVVEELVPPPPEEPEVVTVPAAAGSAGGISRAGAHDVA